MSDVKSTLGFLPSEGEELQGYCERLRLIVQQLEEYSMNHIKWYTHYGAGACWICDGNNVMRYAIDVMNDVALEVASKYRLKARHPKGATNPEYFEFKLQGK